MVTDRDYDRGILDLRTGEIEPLYPGDRVYKNRQREYLDRTIEINKKEPYVKVYIRTMEEVSNRLDAYSQKLLNKLMGYISYEDGILEFSNGRPLTREHIIRVSPLNEKTTIRCLSELIQQQIIGRHKTGRNNCYTVNPFIFMKGQRVSKTLYKLFERSCWAKMN